MKKKNVIAVQKHLAVVPSWSETEATPNTFLQLAIEKGLAIDQLERLIALQERWEAKKAREMYSVAFSAFQKIAPDLKKNKSADFGPNKAKYQYQSLDDIAAHIRGPLASCGLSYKWGQKDEGDDISVWCIVMHVGGHVETGEPLKGKMDTSGNKAGIQAKASTISYLRRYTLTGMLGLSSADVDDDGKKGVASKKQDNPDSLGPIGETQFKATMKKVIIGEATVQKVKEYYQLTVDQETALKTASPFCSCDVPEIPKGIKDLKEVKCEKCKKGFYAEKK